jgi:orotate phosphoribosyltransferase
MNKKPYWNRLYQIIKEKSYREGDFTLTSGKKSRYYIDLKSTTLHPEGAHCIGECVLDLLDEKKLNCDAIGGLTLGADPIATSVSIISFMRGKNLPAFIVRKESKGHGTDQYIEGKENIPKNAKVLILEDVITTGKSSLEAIEKVKAEGYDPLGVLVIVDRKEGGEEKLKEHFSLPLYSLFSIDDFLSKN